MRQCGNCSACCTRMAVEGLKPGHVRCEFQKRDGGCSRYSTRPEGCRVYECGFLTGLPFLEAKDRPDRLGVIFDNAANPTFQEALDSTGLPWVMAREIYPGAFNQGRVVELLEAYSSLGIVVLDYAGGIKGRPALCGPKDAHEALSRVAQAVEAA